MLANLASAINDVPLEFGRDYGVIAFSFDEEDSPVVARQAKGNYAKILEEGLPAAEWRFLTCDLETMHALVNPECVIPMHGEHMHLRAHAKLAQANGRTSLVVAFVEYFWK